MRTSERETNLTVRDPVCGMAVDPKSAAATVERNGESFYFCSTHCRDKFVTGNEQEHSCRDGGDHLPNETKNTVSARQPAKKYFCPMCDGVESDKPGTCPKCGMALERNPALQRAGEDHLHLPDAPGNRAGSSGQLPDVRHGAGAEERRRGRRGRERRAARHDAAVLDRRRAHACRCFCSRWRTFFPHAPQWMDGDPSRWMQFILSTPVVLWAGWPFFVSAAGSRSSTAASTCLRSSRWASAPPSSTARS